MISYQGWQVLNKYLTLIDVSSACHNLTLHERSAYLTFSCPFGRYRFIWLPFAATSMGDMFPKKMGEIFSGMPNVFSIADAF